MDTTQLECRTKALTILERHPDLLVKVLAKSGPFIGEIIAAERLEKLGYTVMPTNNNSRQLDLRATYPSGEGFGVEVKTGMQKRPTWMVNSCPDVTASKIWCMVAAPRSPQNLPNFNTVQVFVLTAEEERSVWLASPYNQKSDKANDIRRKDVPDSSLEAWWKLSK